MNELSWTVGRLIDLRSWVSVAVYPSDEEPLDQFAERKEAHSSSRAVSISDHSSFFPDSGLLSYRGQQSTGARGVGRVSNSIWIANGLTLTLAVRQPPHPPSRVAILVYIRIRYNTPTRIIYIQTFIQQIKAKQTKVQHLLQEYCTSFKTGILYNIRKQEFCTTQKTGILYITYR